MSAGPGWYVDPKNPNVDIYWNGERWSGSRLRSTAPAGQPAAPAGTRLPAAPPGYSAMMPPKAKKPMGCLGFLGIAAAVVVLIVIIITAAGAINASHGPSEEDKQASAQVACEDVVKQNLKSPSTANFSNETTTGSDGKYTIEGDVDAQNSFGAMLRNHFVCDTDGSTASLRSLG